jgi:hypothetical protein
MTYPVVIARDPGFTVALLNQPVPTVPMSAVSAVGPKGDPGGNTMAIGLFDDAHLLTIPVGTDMVRTSGYATPGKGVADYVFDVAVDAAYVAANPRTSFTSANSRGFRLVTEFPNAHQFGAEGDASATGSSGTNDTAAIQAGIDYLSARGGGQLYFPTGHYKCAASLDLGGLHNIALAGPAGSGPGYSMPPAAQIIFTGTGSGRFIDARSGQGITLRDLGIRYTSSSFTGTLVDFSHLTATDASFCLVERCLLWGINVHSAWRLISLDAAILCSVIDCHLAWAQVGVGGRSLPGYSNAHNITRCTFANLTTAAIMNAGEGWAVVSCWFEGTDGGTGGMPRAYFDDQPAGEITWGLSWIGNWHGDGVNVTDAWFANGDTVMRGLNICGGQFNMNFATGKAIKLTASVEGGMISGLASGGVDLCSVTHRGLAITGNYLNTDVENISAACLELWIFANWGISNPVTMFRVHSPGEMTLGNAGSSGIFATLDGVEKIRHDVPNGDELSLGYAALGFFGATPGAKPGVGGSCGGNAALQSLIAHLATLGLITDSTTQ